MLEITEGVLVALLETHWPAKGAPEADDLTSLALALEAQFGVRLDPSAEPFRVNDKPCDDRDDLGRTVLDRLLAALEEKRKRCDELAAEHAEQGYPRFADFERSILLQLLDRQWKDHLHAMDSLREGIGLRGYAQRDPKIEYQREGFALFEEMSARVDGHAAETLFKFVLPDPNAEPARPAAAPGGGGGAPPPGR